MIKTKTMSPLIIVGILISTALADVSHVLSGAAHPPANPVDVNSLSAPKNAFQSGNPNDFWWMASNSPLKEAYDYFKKCSSKGDCLPPESIVPGVKVAEAHFDPIDLKKNPFLNGEFLAGALSSSSSSSSSGCTTCSEGSKPGEVAAFHTGTKIDILKNPFLNGQFATAGNGEKVRNEDGFLGVQPKKPEFATSHPLSNKKPFATFPPNVPQSQQSFVLGGGNIEEQECKGQGYICVSKDLCINGVINKTEDLIPVNNNIQYCNLNTEICCRLTDGPLSIVLSNSDGKNSLASTINNLADITAGKSSVTGSSFKFSRGAGSSPGQIQVLIDGSDDIKPQVYHNSESGSHSSASTNKATRDVTLSANSVFPSTVDYSGVQISNDIRFGSTIQGPAYLPPIGGPIPPSGTPELIAPTQPSIITYQPTVATTPRPVQTTRFVCPPGTFLTSFGICESSSTPAPSCPLGTFRTPDGNCERPIVSTTPRSCPPGTILTAFGSCETPTTPAPRCPFGTFLTPDGSCARSSPPPSPSPSPRPCPPGTFFTASGLCEAPRTPSPSCPFGTVRRSDGICERPSPPLSPISCPAGTFLTASGTCEGPSPPAPSCPFGFIQTPDGTCISPGTPTTPIPCPPGTILTSSGICESLVTPSTRLPCPPGTIQSVSGVCQSVVSTTIGYEYQTPCPPGTFQTSTGLCQKIELSTVTPQCPIGTYLTPTGNCEAPRIPTTPKPPPRPFETTVSRDYLVPVIPTQYVPSVTQKPYQPSITSEKPFQPSVTQQKPSITPFSPFTPSVTPSNPFQPYITQQIPVKTTKKPYYPQVTTPKPFQQPVTTQRPYHPSSPKPNPFITTNTSKIICPAGQVISPSGYGCIYSSTPKPKTCLPGQKLSQSGICEYSSSTSNYQYSTSTQSSYQASRSPSCSPEQVISPVGSCIYPSKLTTPKSNQFTPRPVCLPGQQLSPLGICEYIRTESTIYNQPTTLHPTPNCDIGQVLSSSGLCIYPSEPTTSRPYPVTTKPQARPKPTCAPGQVPSSTGYGCVYPTSTTTIKPTTSTQAYDYPKPITQFCEPGKILSQTGSCIYPSTSKQQCSPGQIPTPTGVGCEYPKTIKPIFPTITKPICPFGTYLSPLTNECVYESSKITSKPHIPLKPSPQPATITSCSAGQILSTSGLCIYPAKPATCRLGQIKSPSGTCIYPSDTTTSVQPTGKPLCETGQILSSGACVYPSQTTPIPEQKCTNGLILSSSGTCLRPPTQCPQGQVPASIGFGCVYPTSPSVKTCPSGKKISPSGVCETIQPTGGYDYPKPTRPSSRTCPPGQVLASSGYGCIYSDITTPKLISCPRGQVTSSSGVGCEYIKTTRPPIVTRPPASCPFGAKLSPITNDCITSPPKQPADYYPRPSTPSITEFPTTIKPLRFKPCPPGQTLSSSGLCIYTILPTTQPISSTEYDYLQPTTPFPQAYTDQTTIRSPFKQCQPGQNLTPSGNCIYSTTTSKIGFTSSCKPGQIISTTGLCTSITPQPTPSVVTGYTYPRPSTSFPISYPGQITNKPTTIKQCGFGQVLSSSGTCVYLSSQTDRPKPSTCKPGQQLSESGICIYTFSSTLKPSCEPGQVLSSSGTCVYSKQTTLQAFSNTTTYYNYSRPLPHFESTYPGPTTIRPTTVRNCGPNKVLSPSGVCTDSKSSCKPGQKLSPSGICIYSPSTKPACTLKQILSSGSCIYSTQTTVQPFNTLSTGYTYSKPSTSFVPTYVDSTTSPTIIKDCGPDKVLSPSGVCIYSKSPCKQGQELSASGVCDYPPNFKPVCGPGQIFSSGSCIYSTPSSVQPVPTPSTEYTYSKPSISIGTTYTGPTTIRPSTSIKDCGPNRVLSPSGVCIYSKLSCKPGQELSSFGTCVYPTSSKPSCGPGQTLSSSGSCIYSKQTTVQPFYSTSTGYAYPRPSTPFEPTYVGSITTRPTTIKDCGPNKVLSPSGVCIYSKSSCKPGQELSSSGLCVYPASSKPSCGPGQTLSPTGSCIYSTQTTVQPFYTTSTEYTYSKPSTPFAPTYVSSTTTRPTTIKDCGPDKVLSPSGVCIYTKSSCKPGQELSPSGVCLYSSSSKPICGPGQIQSSSGSCIYSTQPSVKTTPTPSTEYTYSRPSISLGPTYTGPTTIRPSTAVKDCGPNRVLSPSGVCIYSKLSCKPGQELSSSGICIYPTISKSSCGPGQILSSSGLCVYSSQTTVQYFPTPSTEYTYSKPSTPFAPIYVSSPTVRPASVKDCGPDRVLSPSGVCIYSKSPCKPGQELSSSGICVNSTSFKPLCGPDQTLSSSGLCIYSTETTLHPFYTPTTGYKYPRPSTPFEPTYVGSTTTRPAVIKDCGPDKVLSPSGVCIYSKSPCKQGQELSTSGVCNYPPNFKPVCGPGQFFSSGSCIYSTPSSVQPVPTPSTEHTYSKPSISIGTTYTGPTTIRPSTSIKDCGPNRVLSPSGVCIYSKLSCKPGQELSSFGTCIYPTSSKPSCGPGQILSSSGSCIYSKQTTVQPFYSTSTGYAYPRPSTPFEPTYVGSTTTRPTTIKDCGPNKVLSPSGVCIYLKSSCKPGQELSSSGICVYPASSKPSCGPGQTLSSTGSCIYSTQTTVQPFYTTFTEYTYSKPSTPFAPTYIGSTTTRPTVIKDCGPDKVLSPSGVCSYSKSSCKPGQELSSTGVCIYPSSSKPICGPGQILSSSGSCVYSTQTTVQPFPTPAPSTQYSYSRPSTPSGPIYTGPTTIKPSTAIDCGPNRILSSSGACIYITQSTPKPKLLCGPGQTLSSSGSCIFPTPTSQTIGPKQCPPGSKPSAFGSGCEYPRPTTSRTTIESFTGYKYPKPSKPFEPKPQCPRGTKLNPSGFCVQGPTSPSYESTTIDYDSVCPSGSKLSPSGECQFSSTLSPDYIITSSNSGRQCPFGTRLSSTGSCEHSTGTTPVTPNYKQTCPPGTIKTNSGTCEPSTTPKFTSNKPCPPGSSLSPSGKCQYPNSTPTSGQPSYTNNQLTPFYSSKKPYRPSAPSFTGYYYETPTPTFSYPSSTLIPNSNIINNQYVLPPTTSRPIIIPTGTSYLPPVTTPQYLPPATDKITGGSSIKNEFLPPRRTTSRPIIIPTGTSYLSPVTTPQYLPPATTPQYLPPATDKITGGSSIKNEFLPPRRTTTERPGIDTTGANNNEYIVTIPSTRRPPPFNPEQNNEPPVGCAAALKCVQEIYCTAEGVVSPVPVVLTKDQELLRVPTTVCKDEDSGIIGKCCRDPNYKDPWPSANLVNGVDDGQYKEDNLYGQRELLSTNRLTRSSNVTRSEITQTLQSSQEICGQRHKNTKPPGPGHIDANFSEYPWQAMILRDSNRSLLCGGAIIRRNAVLTAAHCVEGLDTSDVLIKGGEWKLGIDEEPLPFQIVKVGAILRHPEYVPGSYKNDLAVLILREKLRPSKNVGTICLSEANQLPTVNCVATGWGKRILQLHAKGAIMHHINVKVIDAQQCQQTLSQSFQASIENYSPNTLCGVSDIDQCKVDYGSALACSNDQGQYTLTGIYAWDTGCKEENQIGGYIAPDVEWIESILSKPIKELKKIEREYLLKTTN